MAAAFAEALANDPFPYLDTFSAPAANQAAATELMAPCFVGWNLHLILFGCVMANGFSYLRSNLYRSDPRGTKILLWGLLIGDFASTAISFSQSVHYGTSQRRDTEHLLLGYTGLDAVPFVLEGTIAFSVQLALAARASKFFMSHGRILRTVFVPTVGILGGLAWLASIVISALYALFTAGNTSPIIQSNFIFDTMTCVWTFLSAATDLLITGVLLYVLRGEVRGFSKETDDVVRRVIVLGVETGAATSVTAFVGAILAVSFGRDAVTQVNILFPFIFPLSSLYVLSYIVTLNARGDNLRSKAGVPGGRLQLSDLSRTSRASATPSRGALDRIWVMQEQEIKSERLARWGGVKPAMERLDEGVELDVEAQLEV